MQGSSSHSESIEMWPTRTANTGIDDQLARHRSPNFLLDDEPDILLDAVDEKAHQRQLLRKLGLSFFIFGLITNVQFVIILSAALDLVPPSTPKGVIVFCNITPVLIVKIGWPYLLKGRIRYVQRLIGCCFLSFFGMIIVAVFDNFYMRLLGISFAAFTSGLEELTFLQLSTTYSPPYVAGHGVGYFASGTGAAGLVGAFLWWEVRNLGVRVGVGLSSVLPFVIPLTYFFLLPQNSAFLSSGYDSSSDRSIPYAPLPVEDGRDEGGDNLSLGPKRVVTLSARDKWRLVKPMLLKYMLPLFCVYLFEYTINQGIAPTLVYPVPSSRDYPVLGKIIHTFRDYYPLWQLVYQTTVFLSRSSISIGVPPLPARLLSLPAIVQSIILLTLGFESAIGIYSEERNGASIMTVFLLITLEGICGGLAYVNAVYHNNQEPPDHHSAHDAERAKQAKEFKIGAIGIADSLGILFASLIAMPTEMLLCDTQAKRGKLICKSL